MSSEGPVFKNGAALKGPAWAFLGRMPVMFLAALATVLAAGLGQKRLLLFSAEAFVADDAEETVFALGITGVLLFGPLFVTGLELRQDPLFFFFA